MNNQTGTGTAIEIEDLKRQWLSDQSWDIEDTPGFETHKQELYIYRLETENKQMTAELRRYRQFFRTFREMFHG